MKKSFNCNEQQETDPVSAFVVTRTDPWFRRRLQYVTEKEDKMLNIDSTEFSRAQYIVDRVNDLVYKSLKTGFPQFNMRSSNPFVLQGSVADGTKVFAPDEFDYMIPMDLCVDHWKLGSTTNQIYNLSNSRATSGTRVFFNYTVPPPTDKDTIENETIGLVHIFKLKDLNDKPDEHSCSVSADLCPLDKFGDKIEVLSAGEVFDKFFNSVGNLRSPDGVFTINSIRNNDVVAREPGPAIQFTIYYKSRDGIDDQDRTLSIDYVPAVCIGERSFVPKGHHSAFLRKYWRESFSNDELQLIKEINEKTPLFLHLLKSIKALHLDVTKVNSKHFFEEMECIGYASPLDTKCLRINLYEKLLSSTELFDLYFQKFKSLSSFHLKAIVLHLWDRKELWYADEKTLVTEFVKFLKDSLIEGFIFNYFNGRKYLIN